ncbi:hypothetical protein [Roseateles sp. P5_E4]
MRIDARGRGHHGAAGGLPFRAAAAAVGQRRHLAGCAAAAAATVFARLLLAAILPASLWTGVRAGIESRALSLRWRCGA